MNHRTNLKLCYVGGSFAYFTTQDLKDQWGDDWDDAPYEYNAGPPYEPKGDKTERFGLPEWRILKVAFDGVSPLYAGDAYFSVNQINLLGVIPWLEGHTKEGELIQIFAGTTIDEFQQLVKKAQGKTYLAR